MTKNEKPLTRAESPGVESTVAVPQPPTASHTPGPWHVNDVTRLGQARAQVQALSVDLNDRHYVAITDGPDALANARLIAAAPTMYRELQLAATTFSDFSNVLRVFRKDVMSAAADVAERHIRELLAAINPVQQ